jgi:hypothetical protein
MATLPGVPATTAPRLPGSRYDHAFFLAMAVFLTVAMVVGFANTYFLAGLFRAKLPGILIHIHGVVFTLWFVVLLAQSALATVHRVDLHRRLGIAGVVIASVMVPIGMLSTAEFLTRMAAQRLLMLLAVMPIAELGIFAVLAAAAFYHRRSPAIHKRLILLATVGLMGAPVGRMLFLPSWQFHRAAILRLFWGYTYIFIVALIAYDLWSTRKLNRATVWGSAIMIGAQQVFLLIWTTAPWAAFVQWMQSWRI